MMQRLRIPAAVLLALILSACGQSGPLYVTGNPSTIQPAAEQADSEDEDEQDAGDEESQ